MPSLPPVTTATLPVRSGTDESANCESSGASEWEREPPKFSAMVFLTVSMLASGEVGVFGLRPSWTEVRWNGLEAIRLVEGGRMRSCLFRLDVDGRAFEATARPSLAANDIAADYIPSFMRFIRVLSGLRGTAARNSRMTRVSTCS
ncbi:hypothetical protein MPH_11635 [Macrophomina phaseolina MS6]|uniref:Uncharacterized protein n=1 Tax=Macrophomina phaseolina (strain MS6) TaxID=1126212 RepID=K2S3G7_MACPH|nr:hypothetical protein MPH_11635 [Macrophomina phaseolina MS6]